MAEAYKTFTCHAPIMEHCVDGLGSIVVFSYLAVSRYVGHYLPENLVGKGNELIFILAFLWAIIG